MVGLHCYHFPKHNVAVRRVFSKLNVRYSSLATALKPPQREFLKDKIKRVWKGPTFKYWFIGITGFSSWMVYYGLKSYKKSRIDIEILPALPTHSVVQRDSDIKKLFEKYEKQDSLFGGEKIKKLMVLGGSGTGKTVLIYEFAKYLQSKLQQSKYSLPKSHILVFLHGDTEESFLMSLKAFAAKCKIKPSELNEMVNNEQHLFNKASFSDKCDALLACIQESVKKHPDWIVVVDNMQLTSPSSVINIINQWFISDEHIDEWSRGSVFLVHDGLENRLFNIKEAYKHMNYGMSEDEAYQLFQEVVNIDKSTAISQPLKNLIAQLFSNPLAMVCAGMLLRQRLKQKEPITIDTVIKDLSQHIDANLEKVKKDNEHMSQFIDTKSGLKLVTIETTVAMAIKYLFSNDRYLWHGFDMLATIKPGAAVPQSLLARHLKNQFFKLPQITNPGGIANEFFNKQKNDLAVVQGNADEFEPKGKAWSNKNLSQYVRKVEDFFMTGITTVKELYNMLYGELPELPEKMDGLDMFRSCELLQKSTIEPGDTKAISMHPLVYNASRQYFLSATVPHMENEYLMENQMNYHNQSWYKRLNKFSEQTCLHTLRSSAGHQPQKRGDEVKKDIVPQPFLSRYNHGINISSVFKFDPFSEKPEDFWLLKDIDKYRYLQSHVSRVCMSLCDDISVSKGDLSGRNTKNMLLTHLEYIMNNHSLDLIGFDGHMEGLQTIASCYSSLHKDLTCSKDILEDALKMQRLSNSHPLDIAKTLTKIASIQHTLEKYTEAKALLEEASEIYEADRRKCGEYKESLEFGKLLGLLGVVYGAVNMKREAKEAIERSLMLKQVKPPDLSDEPKSKKYGVEFSSSLTDLGHAYVSLGMPLYGRKILDLALAAQKNLLGENHPEVIRTLTVLAIAHLMQGHNEESKKLRYEAGKLQAAVNALPVY